MRFFQGPEERGTLWGTLGCGWRGTSEGPTNRKQLGINNNNTFKWKVAVWVGLGSRAHLGGRVLRTFIAQMTVWWLGSAAQEKVRRRQRGRGLGWGAAVPPWPLRRHSARTTAERLRAGVRSGGVVLSRSEDNIQDSVLHFSRDRKELG